ncbi:hypothetical protein T484DRAFT_3558400 [Baffinella frigidus]|nr:hypothetical protein T484DRAFT_3558400 [Cryptophyta sp. CCMP2293]
MNGGGLPGTLPVIGQGQPRGGRAGIAGASAPLQQSALQQDPAVAAGDTPPIKIPTIEDILPGWGGRFPGTVSMMEQFKAANEAERALKLSYGDRLNTWLMMGGLNKLMGENCLFKGGIALGGGWALGAMFGAFLAPFDTMGGLRVSENATAKETAVATLKQTGTKAHSLGKAFAMIGGVYSITECSIESVRLPPTNPHGRINRSILGWDFPPD